MPLLVAGIGVAGTLAAGIMGALITHRWSERREIAAWAREREREHERWAREDEARTFEQRRHAYLEFYEAVKLLARTAYDHCYGFTEEPELLEGWQSDAFAKLSRLQFYADRPVSTAASAAYGAAWSWGTYGKHNDPDDPGFYERQQKYEDAELAMVLLMRQSLSIPESDLTLPPPGYSYGDQDPAQEQLPEASEARQLNHRPEQP